MISLHKLEFIKSEINELELQRETYKELEASVPAFDYEKVRVDKTVNPEPYFIILNNKILDLESRIEQLHLQYIAIGVELTDAIAKFDGLKEIERKILYYKYIKMQTLEQIADILHVTYYVVKRHHRKA